MPPRTSRSSSSADELLRRRRERAVGADDRLELVQRAATGDEHVGVLRRRTNEHLGAAAPRSGEQRRELLARAGEQRRGTAALGRAHAIDGSERPVLGLPQLACRLRCAHAGLARRDLERVGELGPAQQAGGAQPRKQVGGARVVEQRAAQQGDEPSAQRRVPEGDAALDRDRDAELPEDLRQERRDGRRIAQHDRDLLRRVALLGDEAPDLRRDELELRPLTAALQQRDGVARLDRVGLEEAPVGGQLEQLALEVMQRPAGLRRIVLRARLDDPVDVGTQLGKRRRPARERHPAGLVGERQHDLRARRGERLDGVALQRREVVEAIDEDGRRAPRGRVLADGVQCGGGVQRLVAAAKPLELAPVRRIQSGDLVGVRAAPAVARGPRPQRLREALRRDALLLELVDEAQQRPREAGGPRRPGERAQLRRRDGRRGDPLARERRQRPAADPATAGDLVDEPPEAHDLRAEHRAAAGELRAVALDVGERRHDEDRSLVALERGAVAVEDGASLRGVGRAGDEGERHPCMVARAPDDSPSTPVHRPGRAENRPEPLRSEATGRSLAADAVQIAKRPEAVRVVVRRLRSPHIGRFTD